jgi:two-component system, chemotaxis family, protein-glutamate methylesterase/glutaminase
MPKHDLIAIGASAGGVSALQELVNGLPADIPAAICVVLHIPAWNVSELPSILSRAGQLQAVHPRDGTRVQRGRIYVAPPDRHMILEDGHIHLSAGPKESRTRPAVNPLFRSAALAYGRRVVGVVLTGMLDDGTAGLWEIKRHGGIAVVQNPADAAHPDMPLSALRNVEVDYSIRLTGIAPLLTKLVNEDAVSTDTRREQDMGLSTPILTCPECRGPVEKIQDGKVMELRCRVGHAYSAESFLAAHAETRERTLWAAVVALEEGAQAARELRESTAPEFWKRLAHEAAENQRAAARLRQVVADLTDANSRFLSGEADGGANEAENTL